MECMSGAAPLQRQLLEQFRITSPTVLHLEHVTRVVGTAIKLLCFVQDALELWKQPK